MSEGEYKGSTPSSIMRTIPDAKRVQEKLRELAEAIEKGEPPPPPSAPPPEPTPPDEKPTLPAP